TTNLAVPLSAYDLVTIADPRGNGQTLPVYNLQRAYQGLINELDTTSANNTRVYNGYDVTVNGRGPMGMTLGGGIAVGRTISTMCDVEDPNQLRFCDQSAYHIPFATTVKLNGSYPLPYGFRLSGVFQTANGFNTTAPPTPLLAQSPDNHDRLFTYLVTRTVVPTLTQAQVSVLLDPPGSNYMDRVTQLDFAV